MKNKINKILNLMLLLSILNGNILSMQKSDIEQADIVMQESGEAQAMEIEQGGQQESALLSLPNEIIEYIIYTIRKTYEDRIKNVNNIFDYCQLNLEPLAKALRGAALSSKVLSPWALEAYRKVFTLKKEKYQGLVNIKNNNLEEAITLIILSGADVDANADLMRAAIYGHKGTVQLLINNGADFNQKTNNDYTALMLAAMHGYKDIVQLLIDNGANVNERNNEGDSALILTAMHGHKNIVELLIDGANVDVDTTNYVGETALMWAAMVGYQDIVRLLEAAKNKENQNN